LYWQYVNVTVFVVSMVSLLTYVFHIQPSSALRKVEVPFSPVKGKNPRVNEPLTPKKYFSFLSVFYVSSQEHWYGSCFSSCPPVYIEHPAVCPEDTYGLSNNFDSPIHWTVRETYYYCGDPANLGTSKREGWMCKIGIAFNFVCVYKIYVSAVATSERPEGSLHFFPFSLYCINFFQPGFACCGVPQTSSWL